jgi:hypothetical protein
MRVNLDTFDALISRIANRARTPGRALSGAIANDIAFPPISSIVFDEEEHRLGVRLPQLLRRLYMEVGNGGFGPGEGVLSLSPLSSADHPISYFHGKFRAARNENGAEWPLTIVPFSHWGDLILSCVDISADSANPPVVRFEPNMSKADTLEFLSGAEFRGAGMIAECETLTVWFEDWLNDKEMFHRPYTRQ